MQSGAVYIVDGSGQTTGTTHTRIYAAALQAMPGATIRVVGLSDGSGYPVAYSDGLPVVFAGTQVAEVFPIPLRTGVTLEAYDPSVPVYIWSTSGASALIDVVEASSGSTDLGPARIEDLRIAAAGTGIRARHSNDDHSILIKDCWFAHLGNAVDVMADGVTTSVAVRNCQVRDDPLSVSPQEAAPVPVAPSRGVLLQAAPGGSATEPGVLVGEVTSLQTVGTFSSMAPVDWDIDMLDLRSTFGSSSTRLIEAYSHISPFDEYPNIATTPNTYARSQVCEVRLTVNAGVLDGGASAGGANGWDVGLYAHAQGDGIPQGHSQEFNYNTGFDVTTYGTKFQDFRVAGVVGATYKEGRGAIDLAAKTNISGTGAGQSLGANVGSGVHLFAMEGYLSLAADDLQSYSNAGHGLWANFWGEHGGTHLVPEGIYLALKGCGFHDNGGSGIAMETTASPLNRTGTVGGASYTDTNVVVHRVAEGEGFAQPFGPGSINGCAISNNAGSGIHGHLRGKGFGAPPDPCATLLVRCTNNAIWNNTQGGVTVVLDNPQITSAGGLCLMPITHCTLVNNGGGGPGGWSVEIDDSATSGGRYEVDNYPFDQQILRTRIFNSVMFRDYSNPLSTSSDFGPVLEGALVRFDGNNPITYPIPPNRVGAAGNRARTSLAVPAQTWAWHKSAPHAFTGPMSMSSWAGGQFHLAIGTSGLGPYQDSTPDYLNVYAPESSFDFDGHARPSVGAQQHDRDKGCDEIP